jgi:hypothetical protein
LGLPVLGLLVAFAAVSAARDGSYFNNNVTAVSDGGSITEQRLYTTFVDPFIVTRSPRDGTESPLKA